MYKKVVSPTETTTEFYLQDAIGKTVALRRKVGSAAAAWEYYVNGSEREARIKNVTHNGMIAAQEIEFYLYDHLGNTRVVYEPTYAGGVLELAINYAADYFPYGKVLREYVNTSTGDPEKFLTTQHERDKETGLDYRGARFYDSDVARFLSLDPLAKEFPAWSAYNYVMGNPISLIDPTGRSPEGIDDPKKKDEQKEGRKDLDPNVGTDLPEYTVVEDAPDYGAMMQERSDQNLKNAVATLTTGKPLDSKSNNNTADRFVGYFYEWSAFNILGGGGSTGTLVTEYHGTHDYVTYASHHGEGAQLKSELFSMGPGYGVIISTGPASEVPLEAIINFSTTFEMSASAIVVDVGSKIAFSKTYNDRGDYLMMSGSQISVGVGTPFLSGGITRGRTIIR